MLEFFKTYELQLMLIQTLATVFMTGVIWMIQRVQYPFFHRIQENLFVETLREHQNRMSWIVLPGMLIELITSPVLLIYNPHSVHTTISLTFLMMVWFSTFLVQAPLHRRLLEGGKDTKLIETLVRSNWVRTLAWTGKSLLILQMLLFALATNHR